MTDRDDSDGTFASYVADINGADNIEPYVVMTSEPYFRGERWTSRFKNGHRLEIDKLPSWKGTIGSLYVPPNLELVFYSKQMVRSATNGTSTHVGKYTVPGERTIHDFENDFVLRGAKWQHLDGADGDDESAGCLVDGVSPCTAFVASFAGSASAIEDRLNKTGYVQARSVALDGTIGEIYIRRRSPWTRVMQDSCAGDKPLRIRGRTMSKYEAEGQFCDKYMTEFCESPDSQHRRYNSTCMCLREQTDLPPGASAICFGLTCSEAPHRKGTYVTQQMIEDADGCSNKRCDSVVSDNHEEFLRRGYVNAHCGNKVYDVASEQQPVERHLDGLFIVLGILGGVLLMIAMFYMIKIR